MTSEIRANIIKNRVGLGTIEYSNTGPVISGVTTASNFKTGSSNLHSSGVEVAGINVLGADTPIGLGATIYNSGAAVFTGVVTATSFSGSNINLSGVTTTTDHIHIKADNKQLKIGAHNDGDMLSYHDGNKSVIVNYTGDFHIRSNNGSRSSNEGIILKPNGATEIYHSGNKKLETASTGANVIGNLDVINGHVYINDNYKAYFGTNNDLEIFHNDDDAYVRNNKGALILRNNGQTGDADASQIYIQATPAENSIQCSPNGAVTLYHNNVPQLTTTTAGVSLYRDLDVDGHTNLDNVSVAGVVTATSFSGDGSNLTGITQTTINNNADNRIITGSGTANTLNGEANLTFDGAELDVNNSGGSARLYLISGNSADSSIYFGRQNDGATGGIRYEHTNNSLQFMGYNNSERLRIDSTGRISAGKHGVGTYNDASEWFKVQSNDTAANISIVGSNATHSSLNLGDEDDFNIQKIRSDHTDNKLQFYTNNTERLILQNGGVLSQRVGSNARLSHGILEILSLIHI